MWKPRGTRTALLGAVHYRFTCHSHEGGNPGWSFFISGVSPTRDEVPSTWLRTGLLFRQKGLLKKLGCLTRPTQTRQDPSFHGQGRRQREVREEINVVEGSKAFCLLAEQRERRWRTLRLCSGHAFSTILSLSQCSSKNSIRCCGPAAPKKKKGC